jgi:hypothetical protein
MSDFLTRVAERALGTAPRIDPQSASRYSPSRLPFPESPLPETTKAAVSDAAPIAPSLDSYEQPAPRQLSRPPMVMPLTEDAVATEPGPVPALNSDGAPLELQAPARPLEPQSRSNAQGTQPLELQSKSIAQRTQPAETEPGSIAAERWGAEQLDLDPIPDRPSVDPWRAIIAAEPSMIADDDRASDFASGPLPGEELSRRSSDGYASKSTEAAQSREENEARAVSGPVTKDRNTETKLGVAVESIRTGTAPRDVAVADDRQPAAAVDPRDARGAISADFIRPATARVDNSNYEQEGKGEPTIRVTIGRVEVRSAPPPAVVQPVAPPSPKLSLAEFLRQHNERRR